MDANRAHRESEDSRRVRRRRLNDPQEQQQHVYEEAPDGDGDEMLFADDEEDDNDVMEEPDVYEPCGLTTRTKELQELGEAGPRSTCFGCVYVGEREQTAVPYREVMDLLEMARASIGCSDPVSLAKEMARRFRKMRRECNAQLMPGERPIPEWKAATILEHIKHHNQDPEIQQWVQLRDIQELKDIALQAAVTKRTRSGNLKVDEKQAATYEKLCRLEWFVRRQDPQKCCFYSGGGHIDPKGMRQGLIATSGKPIVALWNNAANKSSTYH